MKTQNSIFTLTQIILFALSTFTFPQNINLNEKIKEGKEMLHQAYIKWDLDLFRNANNLFERILFTDPNNELAQYYKSYTEYRLVNYGLDNTHKKLYDQYLNSAIENGEKLREIKNKKLKSDGLVVLASIYMMKLSKATLEAPILSMKVNSLLDDAEKLDSQNPRIYLLKGMMKYNTPGIFGGSFDDAIENLQKALTLFEQSKSDDLFPDWGKAESLAWLGLSYQAKEDFIKAENSFNKTLEIEPEFIWVKYNLLPELQKERNKK
ncbi:MAG: hypothetical protein STSR0008_06320 [Ignavibacterium sp.]